MGCPSNPFRVYSGADRTTERRAEVLQGEPEEIQMMAVSMKGSPRTIRS